MPAYATTADLVTYGMPTTALGQLTTVQQNAALAAASKIVDTYLRGRYALPLVAWGTEITDATCRIAAFNLLSVRGYNSASGADVGLRERYQDALEWLSAVQRRAAHPDVTETAVNADYAQPVVLSSSVVSVQTGATRANRGW